MHQVYNISQLNTSEQQNNKVPLTRCSLKYDNHKGPDHQRVLQPRLMTHFTC